MVCRGGMGEGGIDSVSLNKDACSLVVPGAQQYVADWPKRARHIPSWVNGSGVALSGKKARGAHARVLTVLRACCTTTDTDSDTPALLARTPSMAELEYYEGLSSVSKSNFFALSLSWSPQRISQLVYIYRYFSCFRKSCFMHIYKYI